MVAKVAAMAEGITRNYEKNDEHHLILLNVRS